MKFLLDMPISASLLNVIRSFGHEGVHAHQIGKACAPDEELLELARQEERVIVTADLDFPRLLEKKKTGEKVSPYLPIFPAVSDE